MVYRRFSCILLLIIGVVGSCCLVHAQTDESASGLLAPTQYFAQPLRPFLNRGVWPGYLNYGKHAYKTAAVSASSFELYDRMGYHLFRGYPLFKWAETRSDSLGLQVSDVVREIYFFRFFGSLAIVQDAYRGWNLSMIVGDNIRTALTPLTLQMPRWQGVRVDGDSPHHGFTALLTRGSTGRFSALHHQRDRSPVLAYGGHWYSRFKDVLVLGATIFNQHQVDIESKTGSFVHGTLPYPMSPPTTIFVQVESDAPMDGTPAGVYSAHIRLTVRRTDGTRVTLTSDPEAGPGVEYDPALAPSVTGRRVGDHWEVNDAGEYVVFAFEVPQVEAIEKGAFEAEVSGDYRIGVRQVHAFLNTSRSTPRWEERSWPSKPNLKRYSGSPKYPLDFKPMDEEPYYTVARAGGCPGLDRVRVVRFDYGIPVGQTFLGADFRIEARELLAQGEVVYNLQEARFPFASDSLDIMGDRLDTGRWAYYFNAVKPLRLGGFGMELGGELFRMDPDYGGGYDSRRGGTVFFTDRGGSKGGDAVTQEFPLVEDNDDDDMYADDTLNDEGRFQEFVFHRYSGGDAHSGVYPGLDQDGDNSPDTDRDRNGIPDWTQPFLLYESDPAEFVYGMDLNNNGYPDFRENDPHADYPVRRDQKGYNLYLSLLDPLPRLSRVMLGYYSIREVSGWGRARAPYASLQGEWYPVRSMDVAFDDDVKYVKDTIRDDVYPFFEGPTDSMNTASPLFPPPPDPLMMKKSLVNTASLRLSYRPVSSVQLRTDVLHLTNRQYEYADPCGGAQNRDLFTEVSLVSRAEYTFSWSRFRLWSGMKFALKEGDRRSLSQTASSIRFFAPVIKVSFEFMPGTTLQWGMSGIGNLPIRYSDHVDRTNSYEEKSMIFLVNGTSDRYLGAYGVSISVGCQFHSVDYDSFGPERDSDTFGFFVDMLGWNR